MLELQIVLLQIYVLLLLTHLAFLLRFQFLHRENFESIGGGVVVVVDDAASNRHCSLV